LRIRSGSNMRAPEWIVPNPYSLSAQAPTNI
jgi:hypothetical protein